MQVRRRLFYGWWIVAAGFIIVACGALGSEFLSSQLPGLLKEHFRSSAVTLGTTLSIYGLSGSIALLAIGPLIDRFGPRKLMLVGIPMAGIGFILLSFANSIVALNIILGALLGIGIKAGFLLPVQTAGANWFIKKRSFALGLIMAASVLGEAVITLFAEHFEGQTDWRMVFVWLGVGILVICIPLTFIIRHRPENYGDMPDGNTIVSDEEGEPGTETTSRVLEIDFTLWQALRTRAFWLLAIATSLSGGINTMATIFQRPFLIDAGFSQMAITDIFRTAPLMGLVGILLFGYLGDRFPKRYLLAIAVVLQSASAIILMTAGNTLQLYLYTLVYAFGSGTLPLLLAIRADYFGRKAFATITVVIMFIGSLIGIPLSMPWAPLGGWIFDVTRSYQLIFLSSTFLGLIPAAIFFFARPPRPPKRHDIPIRILGS